MKRLILRQLFVLIGGLAICAVTAGAGLPTGTPAPDASLIRYRLEPKNFEVAILGGQQGEPLTLRLTASNTGTAVQTASLALNTAWLTRLGPVIPRYIGLGARTFTAKLWGGALAGVRNLRFEFDRYEGGTLTLPVSAAGLQPGQWNLVRFADPALGSIEHPLITVRLACEIAPGAATGLSLAEPTLVTADQTMYAMLTPRMPLQVAGMRQPLASAPAKPLPVRDALVMGGYPLDQAGWFEGVPAMAAFMEKRFPEADFIVAPVWDPYPILAQRLPRLPANTYFQFQKAMQNTDYLVATKASPKNAAGADWTNASGGIPALTPPYIAALKDEMDYAASLGVNNFKEVDYVFPYMNGPWGFDHYSIAAFRDDLNGKDEGLLLLPGLNDPKGGLIHFWDYFAHNHGRVLQPADLGLPSWSHYVPMTERASMNAGLAGAYNLSVYYALFHYEWLRQAQRFGRWAKAHGGTHEFTLNPEDINNGGDYLYLPRLADAGIPYFELFGGPAGLEYQYYALPMYVRNAALAGKPLGMIMEIGSGGHGEPYVDPEVAYLQAYQAGALGFRNYHNEWMEAPWPALGDPKNAYLYDRFSMWMSGAYGLRRACREATSRTPSEVITVSLRNAVHFNWSIPITQMDALATPLAQAHVDFEQVCPDVLPAYLPTARVVIYTPPAGPENLSGPLRAWLALGGKTVVTHSYLPISADGGHASLNGVPAGIAGAVKSGHPPAFALLPPLAGLRVTDAGRWLLSPPTAATAKTLLGTAAAPLLSRLVLPKGSCILYLHVRPQDLTGAQLAAVVETLIRAAHLPRLAVADTALGDPVMTYRFQHGATAVLTLWNRVRIAQLDAQGDLMANRGADRFDPKKRPYPYLAPGMKCGARVTVGQPGTYRVYGFLKNTEQTVVVGTDKRLPLTVEGAIGEQFYLAPDGEAIRKEIRELRQFRAEIMPFWLNMKPE